MVTRTTNELFAHGQEATDWNGGKSIDPGPSSERHVYEKHALQPMLGTPMLAYNEAQAQLGNTPQKLKIA